MICIYIAMLTTDIATKQLSRQSTNVQTISDNERKQNKTNT